MPTLPKPARYRQACDLWSKAALSLAMKSSKASNVHSRRVVGPIHD
jgi:hypothetical protein